MRSFITVLAFLAGCADTECPPSGDTVININLPETTESTDTVDSDTATEDTDSGDTGEVEDTAIDTAQPDEDPGQLTITDNWNAVSTDGTRPFSHSFRLTQSGHPIEIDQVQFSAYMSGDYASGENYDALNAGEPGVVGIAGVDGEGFNWVQRPYGYGTFPTGDGGSYWTQVDWMWSATVLAEQPYLGLLDARTMSGDEIQNVDLWVQGLATIVPDWEAIGLILYVDYTDTVTGEQKMTMLNTVIWILPPTE